MKITEELKDKLSRLVGVATLGLLDDVEKIALSFTDEELFAVKGLAKFYTDTVALIEEIKEEN